MYSAVVLCAQTESHRTTGGGGNLLESSSNVHEHIHRTESYLCVFSSTDNDQNEDVGSVRKRLGDERAASA